MTQLDLFPRLLCSRCRKWALDKRTYRQQGLDTNCWCLSL
jgi:hypothetical protein